MTDDLHNLGTSNTFAPPPPHLDLPDRMVWKCFGELGYLDHCTGEASKMVFHSLTGTIPAPWTVLAEFTGSADVHVDLATLAKLFIPNRARQVFLLLINTTYALVCVAPDGGRCYANLGETSWADSFNTSSLARFRTLIDGLMCSEPRVQLCDAISHSECSCCPNPPRHVKVWFHAWEPSLDMLITDDLRLILSGGKHLRLIEPSVPELRPSDAWSEIGVFHEKKHWFTTLQVSHPSNGKRVWCLFLVDTGGAFTALRPETFAALGYEIPGPSPRTYPVGASADQVERIKAEYSDECKDYYEDPKLEKFFYVHGFYLKCKISCAHYAGYDVLGSTFLSGCSAVLNIDYGSETMTLSRKTD